MASHPVSLSFARLAVFIPCFLACFSAQAHPFRGALHHGLFRAQLPLAGANSYSPRARARHDLGPTPATVQTGKLRLLLKRSAEREAALQQFLASVKDPRSPEYRRWLTPEQYGARFGATDEDLRTASTWLMGQGFRVEAAPPGRSFLAFSGTVSQLNHAFGASVHTYGVGGAEHHGTAQEPRMPTALKGIAQALSPLNDFRGASLVNKQAEGRLTAAPGRGLRALLSDPGNGSFYITPAEAATVYNAPNAFNRNAPSGVSRTGTGVNIGIISYSELATADYLDYRRVFLNEPSPASPIPVTDGVAPGVLDQHDGQVALIAAEIAAGLAPGAAIYVYSSQSDLMEDGLINAITRAVEDNQVSILSLSYSTCEKDLGSGGNFQISELWKQAAAQGISVVVAAGDAGSAGCDDSGSTSAGSGLAVNGFASTPYDLAVGGTDFDYAGAAFQRFLSAGANAASPAAAALAGYVPESPWNDSISNNPAGPLATNVAAQYDYGSGPAPHVAGGGGGLSSMAVCPDAGYSGGSCDGSLAGYALPAYQSATGQSTRALPDVALFAGTHRQYQATWAVCSDDQVAQANHPFTDCVPGADGSFSVEGAGGTGTAATAFAGILALVSESLGGKRLGVANDVLYQLASAPNQQVFHDIAAGNNAVPCASGSPACGAGGFLNGYDAGPGYDLATGLGSVDVSALIAAWPSVLFTPTTTTLTVNGGSGSATIRHGTGVTLGAVVTPGSVTGSVSVTGSANQAGAGVNEIIPLTGGTGSTFTRKLPGGTYSIAGTYSGDVSDAASTSQPVQITVTKEDSVLRLSDEIQNLNDRSTTSNVTSIPYGTYGFLYAQPVGAASNADGPATGAVNLLNGNAPLSTQDALSMQTLNSVGRAAYPLDLFPPGAYQLSATYGGDVSYNPSPVPSPIALTVTLAKTRLSAAVSAPSIDVGVTASVTVTLDTDSTGAFPSGGMTLAANGTNFPGMIRQVRTAINSDREIAVFQVSGSALVSGANTFTATYPGDGNYASSSATVVLTVTGVPPTFTMTGPSGGMTLTAAQTSADGTLTLQAKNGFAGTVQLACSFPASTAASAPDCSVTPSATLAADGSASATVTIGAPLVFAWNSGGGERLDRLRGAGGGFALASLLLLLPRAHRRATGTMLAVLTLVGMAGAIGCGTHANRHARATGTYTATITGTSGSTVVITPIQVQIQ